jgi:hypothetical protein
METKSPILAQAREFAEGVHRVYPEQWLAYNLSPSFNWDAAGLGDRDMKDYVWQLGKLGFVWQFITVRAVRYPERPVFACGIFVDDSLLVCSSVACTRTDTSRTCSRGLSRQRA